MVPKISMEAVSINSDLRSLVLSVIGSPFTLNSPVNGLILSEARGFCNLPRVSLLLFPRRSARDAERKRMK